MGAHYSRPPLTRGDRGQAEGEGGRGGEVKHLVLLESRVSEQSPRSNDLEQYPGPPPLMNQFISFSLQHGCIHLLRKNVLFYAKILLRITIAYGFHHRADVIQIVGKLSSFDVSAQVIAKYPSEIFMAGE